jgi:hypothetical protein
LQDSRASRWLLFYQGESTHYYGFSPDVCIRDANQKKEIFRQAAVILSRNAFEQAMCSQQNIHFNEEMF